MVNIDSNLKEKRLFKPTKEFSKKAHIQSLAQYRALCRQAKKKSREFLGEACERTFDLVFPVEKKR